MKLVAVTGMGCVTPCGNSVEEYWESLCAGRSGIARITRFDTTDYTVHIAGELKNFVAEEFGIAPKDARRLDRFAQYGLVAACQAMAQSGLVEGGENRGAFDAEMTGVCIGTGIGGLRAIEIECDNLIHKGPRRVSPTLVPSGVPDVPGNEVALKFGFRGPSCAVCSACASGNDALIYACRCIREGIADVMVAGGAEATVTPIAISTFGNLRALSSSGGDPRQVCRPFDRDRSGFVMGEGAGVFVLESLDHARRRGADVFAILAGYGQTCDSFHRTAPDPTGSGAARAIRQCLKVAGLSPADVDYINAHGTSTISNDPVETMAIKAALGDDARRIAVSSTKSMTGHLIGAAGGIEAIAAVLAIRHGVIPPTINLDEADPRCDLDYVANEARQCRVEVSISNTFGFGGHNATVLFRAP
ncbi:MAG: beta-ketoacyl-ACP synthase II [Planctomycetota bacterium]|nr:beta-ketoacyl-ACP synthase II [Planctomycetota bacterium]